MRLSIRQHLYLYQSDSTSLRDYVQAVQPEVCTTGMLANVNQALQLVWDTSKQLLH
jgi:ligand-binding SRPBCC domain-containing protein